MEVIISRYQIGKLFFVERCPTPMMSRESCTHISLSSMHVDVSLVVTKPVTLGSIITYRSARPLWFDLVLGLPNHKLADWKLRVMIASKLDSPCTNSCH